MGFDAGYHSAGIARLLEAKEIQGVIGYRRHTHRGEHYRQTATFRDERGAAVC
ncbi:MAG: hypothetical protein GX592_00085 [Clostridiales bacterium]|nr:hypothetical protein [Clostridiales bacterium]